MGACPRLYPMMYFCSCFSSKWLHADPENWKLNVSRAVPARHSQIKFPACLNAAVAVKIID